MKCCTRCLEIKPLTDFYKDITHKDNLTTHCKPCKTISNTRYTVTNSVRVTEYKREHYLENIDDYKNKAKLQRLKDPEKVKEYEKSRREFLKETDLEGYRLSMRRSSLKNSYGLTLEDFSKILESQNDSCKICKRHKSEFKQNLAVDHNHETGEIRGLLCNYCNHKLVGKHKDGSMFRFIAEYIEGGLGLFIPENKKRRGS